MSIETLARTGASGFEAAFAFRGDADAAAEAAPTTIRSRREIEGRSVGGMWRSGPLCRPKSSLPDETLSGRLGENEPGALAGSLTLLAAGG
ncbi:hypothetical protein GCM10010983_04990 [Caulobacter rhizosphaerae]|nr:hypothetical protein GCM10010983_04990 [Caulobacter rhizosphaerae]